MDLDRVKILLVEDDPDDVWIMRSLLGDRWDGPFDLVHVELLADALRCCRDDVFDVILLDLSLPDSRGLETFLLVYAHAGDTPIVVLTGDDDERAAIRAVQAGAQDYLIKGQVDDNVLVRSARYAIERSRRHQAEEELRVTSEEFRIAQRLQKRLFPTEPPRVPGFDIAGALYPAKATAGDYFDFVPMRDDHLGIVLGDVSGHGMGPAMLMAETRACLRVLVETHSDVGDILTRANRVLTADIDDFHFVTLMMARLDPARRELVYASAGQRGYLFDRGGDVTILDSTSPPLGIDRQWSVATAPAIPLRNGQVMALFTDGVVEAESLAESRFGAHNALEVIRDHLDHPAEKILAALRGAIDQFTHHRPQADDITIVIVKVLDEATSA